MNGQIFSLVIFAEDGTVIVVKSKPYKRYRDTYIKSWVLNCLQKEEDRFGKINDFEVYKGESNDFADWYDLEPIYLDIS